MGDIMTITQIKDEAHWRELRAAHIGASEIATLFSESPYLTPNQLFHMKRGNLGDVEESPLMRFGQLMEPVVAALIVEHYQWDMVKCQEYHEHPEFPWLGCTLDYYCTHPEHGPGIVQIKNVQNFAPGWTQSRAPTHVELQVQHELFVTNAARLAAGKEPFRWTAIGSMHAGNPEDIRVFFREQDKKVTDHIVNRSRKFWEDMKANNEPPLLGGQDYEHIVDLFKSAEDLPPEFKDFRGNGVFEMWAFEYVTAGMERLSAEKRQKEMKTRILHAMLDTTKPEPGRVTTAHTGRASVTVKFSSNGALRMDVKTLDEPVKKSETIVDHDGNIVLSV